MTATSSGLGCYSNVASPKLVYGNPLRSIVSKRIEPLLSFFFRLLLPLTRYSADRLRPTLPGCRVPWAAIEKENIEMANGTVKWFNTSKGFGFIAPDDGGKDVFVHISAVERSGLTGLADDQKVTFDLEAGRDGRESATNLALV